MLRVKKIYNDAKTPVRGTQGSAGYDLSSVETIGIPPWSRKIIKTGLAVSVPVGTYGRVAPRSGLAAKKSIDVAAGVIDSDYTGEIRVILVNNSNSEFEVKTGDRIAQLIIEVISTPEIEVVDDLDSTVRGGKGFGSTGMNIINKF